MLLYLAIKGIDNMRIYGFYNEYSGHEIDTALREMTSSEYRTLENIFDDRGINMSKYHEDRSNFSESIVLKFTKVLERNRKEGIISFNELTLKIIDLINSGKSNKEICNELNIDYKILYYELKKVRNFKRNFDREYFSDGRIVGKKEVNQNKSTINIGNITELKVLVISDLHYGNSLENINAVNRAFNYAKGRGINIILCCGDFIDGSFSKRRQIVDRYFKQFEHFAIDYPFDKDITTFGVGGNHDYSIKMNDELDFIKFCKMYRDDVFILDYCNGIINLGNDSIQMYHEIKEFHKLMSSSSIILIGHTHKFAVNYISGKNYLNIYVPSLSNLVQTVPEALELDLSLDHGMITNVNVKEICFGNRDIILSENDYNFVRKNKGELIKKRPLIKELEKKSSQIDKFNKRYGL